MNFLPVNQPNDPPHPAPPAPAEDRPAQSSDLARGEDQAGGPAARGLEWISARLNFYRIHLLHFTLTPLITAGIFYASNGQNGHSYVNSLYMVSTTSAQAQSGSGTLGRSDSRADRAGLIVCRLCLR